MHGRHLTSNEIEERCLIWPKYFYFLGGERLQSRQIPLENLLAKQDFKEGEGGHQPVSEAHAVLLHVQCGELLVVPQVLLLLAGDTQVEAQHAARLQLHRLAGVQTCDAVTGFAVNVSSVVQSV